MVASAPENRAGWNTPTIGCVGTDQYPTGYVNAQRSEAPGDAAPRKISFWRHRNRTERTAPYGHHCPDRDPDPGGPVSYTHLRAHETDSYLVCRLLLEKKNKRGVRAVQPE